MLLYTTAAIIFRAEIALLLAFTALQLLLTRRIALTQLLSAGIAGAVVGLTATLTVDSYFWLSFTPKPIFETLGLTQYTGLIWPELSTFLFNFISDGAKEWGVSPWHTYFTSSIPKLLLNPISLLTLPLGARYHTYLLLPALAFVAVYSTLGHKEWRFIIYILPSLTLTSALGASRIWGNRRKSLVQGLLALGVLGSLLVSAGMAGGMAWISSMNYPGGEALGRLTPRLQRGETVWMDTETCMTGASRFLQVPGVEWNKNEDETKPLGFWAGVDWAVVKDRGVVKGDWEVVDSVDGYAGVDLTPLKHLKYPVVKKARKLLILRKKSEHVVIT